MGLWLHEGGVEAIGPIDEVVGAYKNFLKGSYAVTRVSS